MSAELHVQQQRPAQQQSHQPGHQIEMIPQPYSEKRNYCAANKLEGNAALTAELGVQLQLSRTAVS